MAVSNLRQNPFNSAFSFRDITDEAQTVGEFDFLPGLFGFILDDRPTADNDDVTFTTDDTAATVFTIITSGSPLPGQVRYDPSRGICLFNIADDTQDFLITYKGAGTNNTVEALAALASVPTQAQINALAPIVPLLASLDEFIVGDITGGPAANKITRDNLAANIIGKSTLVTTLSEIAKFAAEDSGAESITVPNSRQVILDFDKLREILTPALASDDFLALLSDVSSPEAYKMTIETLLSHQYLTSLTNPDEDDTVIIFDTVAGIVKKVKKSLLLPSSHLWMQTFSGFSSANLAVPFFSTVQEGALTDPNGRYTAVNGSTDGFAVTIDKPGKFAISAIWQGPDTTLASAGFTLNATAAERDINPGDIADETHVLAFFQGHSTIAPTTAVLAITRFFAINDVIRLQARINTPNNSEFVKFNIEAVL